MISQNSLANLRPWRRGNAPKGSSARHSNDINKTLRIARKGCPEAMLYALQVLKDPEESTRYRLKAAEIILATGMPKNPEALAQIAVGGGGPEWLELRFVEPGQPAAASETHRIAFDERTIEAEASDISDLAENGDE